MLIRPVVVATTGDDGWKTIGLDVTTNEAICSSLASGVGGVGKQGAFFCKGRFFKTEATIDFVGGDLNKTMPFLLPPVSSAGIQQIQCAQDVGLHEDPSALDGAIHMRFCG